MTVMYKMSFKDRKLSVSPGTLLSVFCLLLYSAGFIRVELKFNDHDQRLLAVEEVISRLKERSGEMAKVSNEATRKQNFSNSRSLQRLRRAISSPATSNDSAFVKEALEDIFSLSLKICQKRGNLNVCPRGRPGPPGRAGTKGDKGDEGRSGRKGSQGVMGPPGRSGKRGIMGPPGIRGERGIKGDIGPPGIPGIKGEPGESISKPIVKISPPQLTVNERNTAILFCAVSANPQAQISWTRMNGSLPSNRTKVTSDGLMQIADVRLEDAGKYKCVAKNILGKDEKVASVIVQGKPKVFLSLGPSYVEKYKNITLPVCYVKSFPPAVITWSKLNGRVPLGATFKDGDLSIINAQKKDSGLYRCEASNSLGQDSALTQLVVVELPRFTVRPSSKLNVFVYQDITVPCQATGDPKPTVTWKKENGELPSGRSKVSVDGTLEIWNAKEEDSGRYTCTASSNEFFAKATSTMELTVAGLRTCSDAPLTTGVYKIRLNQGSGIFPVYCDQTTDEGVWTMVFKFVGGNKGSRTSYQLWSSSDTLAENVEAALDTTSAYSDHYKNRIVQNWQSFNPQEARVVFYAGGKEVAFLKFNVAGTDKINWFSQKNLVLSSWSDLKSATNLLKFGILGACCSRTFEITANYGGCNVDAGWLVITGSTCSWETAHPASSILYSKQGNVITWYKHRADVGVADVMVVYIR